MQPTSMTPTPQPHEEPRDVRVGRLFFRNTERKTSLNIFLSTLKNFSFSPEFVVFHSTKLRNFEMGLQPTHTHVQAQVGQAAAQTPADGTLKQRPVWVMHAIQVVVLPDVVPNDCPCGGRQWRTTQKRRSYCVSDPGKSLHITSHHVHKGSLL